MIGAAGIPVTLHFSSHLRRAMHRVAKLPTSGVAPTFRLNVSRPFSNLH
jgi:hypothetical protein